MHTMKSTEELFEDDPFEEERLRAAEHKRKREDERRRKKEEERRLREEEEAKKSDQEKLEDVWGKTADVKSVDTLEDVGTAALVKMQDDESSEDDGVPAHELLDDGGAAVIQASLTAAMNAILDIACGEFEEDDEDDEEYSYSVITLGDDDDHGYGDQVDGANDFDEKEEEKHPINLQENESTHKNALPSGTLDTDTKKAFHLVLGSDFDNADGHQALTKSLSPHTDKLMQDFDNDGDLEDAMEMAMQIDSDNDNDNDLDVDVLAVFHKDKKNEDNDKKTLSVAQFDKTDSIMSVDMNEINDLLGDMDIEDE
eukprot:140696_1